MKTLSAMIFTLFAFAFMACENNNKNEEYAFDDWDNDADEVIDQDEYASTFTDEGFYDDWDANADRNIDENEWQTGINNNYKNYDRNTYGEFSDWDTDQDNFLNEEELVLGNFTVYDTDRDGNIEVAEYELWSTQKGDQTVANTEDEE